MPLFLQSISCPAWLHGVFVVLQPLLTLPGKKKKSYSLYLNMRMFKILRLKNYCSDIFLACYTFGNTVINTKWYFIFIFKQIMNYKQNTQVVSSTLRSPLRDIVVGKIWGAWEEKICFKCFAFSQETLRSLAKPVEFGQTLPVYFTACSGYSSNVHNGAVHRVLF